MSTDDIVYLMYHELEVEGRPLCQSAQGYARYVVRESSFREQMQWLRSAEIRGISVSEGLGAKTKPSIVITFDDGCETDLISAAPLLRELNFGATFYITVNFLGSPGYMLPQQVRELCDAGFEIGCHSMSHPYLDNLSRKELNVEIVDARTRLEDMIGRPVDHFSCPGGRWTPQVSQIARDAGYRSVTSSRMAANRPGGDLFQLARIAVMRGLPLPSFQDVCLGRGLWQRQAKNFLQNTAHRLLGNVFYDRLRSLVLERGTER